MMPPTKKEYKLKQEPKNVKPMAGFISLRWVVKKTKVQLLEDTQKDAAELYIDQMGEGTEELTEARAGDEVIIIMDPKESVAYGHKDLGMEHTRVLCKPKNIAAVLTPKKNTKIH